MGGRGGGDVVALGLLLGTVGGAALAWALWGPLAVPLEAVGLPGALFWAPTALYTLGLTVRDYADDAEACWPPGALAAGLAWALVGPWAAAAALAGLVADWAVYRGLCWEPLPGIGLHEGWYTRVIMSDLAGALVALAVTQWLQPAGPVPAGTLGSQLGTVVATECCTLALLLLYHWRLA